MPYSVCTGSLHGPHTAQGVCAALTRANTVTELLHTAHEIWCGPDCPTAPDCRFLHHQTTTPAVGTPRAVRSRYNKDTAALFALMGGVGYTPHTPRSHEINLWPLLRAATQRVDHEPPKRHHYADWSRKNAATASEVIQYVCRDSIQYMGIWCGAEFARHPAAVHYLAFSVLSDDLCVPPLDLVHGQFRMYGRSLADLAAVFDATGWGHDGAHALLTLVRQYIVQYVEKTVADIHNRLTALPTVWDSTLFRLHTANSYGVAIMVARIHGTGPVRTQWLTDSGICNCLSMDLAKSAADIYQHDQYPPTAHPSDEQRRQAAYHSIYLDLMDDLVATGVPEPLVHFGRSGFLFVPLQERYMERALGSRIPLRAPVLAMLNTIFGTGSPATDATDIAFHRAHTALTR